MTKKRATNRRPRPISQNRFTCDGREAKKSLINCLNFYLPANMVELDLAYRKGIYFCSQDGIANYS